MLKDTVAILLVLGGVVIAGAQGGDDQPARPVEVDVSRVPLSAALRFDAAIGRLSLDCAVRPARLRSVLNAHAARTGVRRRAVKRLPVPAAPPLPEVASRGGVDQTGLSSGS
jgi:hypothetical protein